MQLFLKFAKEWGSTTLGLVGTVTALLIAGYIAYFSHNDAPTLQTNDVQILSTSQSSKAPAATHETTVTKPVRLLLPSVNLAVNIDDATIDITTNEWPLSASNAQYANFTPGLGSKKGTMLVYGHNTWSVMRKTGDLQIGDQLALIDQNNKSWQFILTKEEIIVPENVGFIYEDVPFRVVIFTCNGWNDQYRRLMFFEPVV